jgi:hypothetical protein
MLSERKIIDLIELVEMTHIQVREANIIEKDGVVIAKTFHRFMLRPGDDVSLQDPKIQAIANIIWTEDVIEEYKSLQSPDKYI